MPHPDQKKKLSDATLLKQMQEGAAPPDLPPPFKTQTVDPQVDDERSMFKRADRPQEEHETEPELPDPFAVSETQVEAGAETEAPEQTTDQIELLQQIVTLLENLPDEIGDAVADALGVNE